MIKSWKVEKSEILSSNRVFSVRKDKSLSPEDGKLHDFYVVEAPDWINVVAITPENEFLLIKQYRHGIRKITIEIPGGMIDTGEFPLESAKRELLEETGFKSENWKQIGMVHPNPAIMSNSCHTFLAIDCKKVSQPDFDSTENIETFSCPVDEIKRYITEGSITHSLVVAAFNFYFLKS
ncbi:MAG: NUDIX hydrolase [Thermodesulfobacteriota bacterium]